MKKVVTYQSTASVPQRPTRMSICPDCATALEENKKWPRDRCGEPVTQVYHGLHDGVCQVCEGEA